MRDDEDRPPHSLHFPRQQDTICHERSLHSENVEESLVDSEQLRTASLQTNRAGARRLGKRGIEKRTVLPRRCDPLVIVLVRPALSLYADAGAVRTAEANGGIVRIVNAKRWRMLELQIHISITLDRVRTW